MSFFGYALSDGEVSEVSEQGLTRFASALYQEGIYATADVHPHHARARMRTHWMAHIVWHTLYGTHWMAHGYGYGVDDDARQRSWRSRRWQCE